MVLADGIQYKLPQLNYGNGWIEVINTYRNTITPDGTKYEPGDTIIAEARSIIVLHNPVTN